jgi:hypothetical protein
MILRYDDTSMITIVKRQKLLPPLLSFTSAFHRDLCPLACKADAALPQPKTYPQLRWSPSIITYASPWVAFETMSPTYHVQMAMTLGMSKSSKV